MRIPKLQNKPYFANKFCDPEPYNLTEVETQLKKRRQSEGKIFSGFILNPYLRDGFFASSEELDRNKRLRVLQLRNDEVAEFRGRTMVPLKEHEIQDVEFQSYGKS